MKRDLGAVFIVTIAMTLFTIPNTRPGGSSASDQSSSANRFFPSDTQAPLFEICKISDGSLCENCGPTQFCPSQDLVDTIEAFFVPRINGAKLPPTSLPGDKGPTNIARAEPPSLSQDSTRDDLRKHWGVPNDVRGDLRFVVAIVPDPVHTHLSLFFDRQIEAIEQAAQRSGYIFARASLPWETRDHPESSDIRIRLIQLDYEQSKERLPGLMIFRKATPQSQTDTNGSLFIFIVGETPTGGINKTQFHNAISAMQDIRAGSHASPEPLSILGPTFSGSLYSLMFLLKQGPEEMFPDIQVQSGTVSSWSTVNWFETYREKPKNVTFRTFQESDCIDLARLLKFLEQKGYQPNQTALLTEDETAYGNQSLDDQSPCSFPSDLEQVYFPREISHLRSAYQHEIQNEGITDNNTKRPARSTLPSNLEDAGNDDDSIAPYSRLQTPLSQEAVLMGIVSNLQKHHPYFVVLRATNPLDALFLSHFLRKAYPEGRIITIGADLLFQREIDDPNLRGILAITSYSLLPGINDEMARPRGVPKGPHVDRVFPGNYSVGTYNALLSLLTYQQVEKGRSASQPSQANKPRAACTCPQTNCENAELPSAPYEEYGWPSLGGAVNRCMLVPPLWLTVLGRSGYWPVALLEGDPDEKSQPTSLYSVRDSSIPSKLKRHIPLSWAILCGACIMFVLAYMFLIRQGSIASASDAVANFAPFRYPVRNWILLRAHLFQVLLIFLLLWPLVRWIAHFTEWWLCVLLALLIALLIATCFGDLRGRGSVRKANIFLSASIVLAIAFLSSEWLGSGSPINLGVYRYVHITSGVSPLVPFLLLLAAGLWWTWYGIAGLALIDPRRPRLPTTRDFGMKQSKKRNGDEVSIAKMRFGGLSREANRALMLVMHPASADHRVWLFPAMLTLFALAIVGPLHPVQSLEGKWYDRTYACSVAVAVFVLLCTLFRLVVVWMEFRPLLLALDWLPLRRGFEDLKGFTWRPIWRLGGSAIADSYRVQSRATETLGQLKNEDGELNAFTRIKKRRLEYLKEYREYELGMRENSESRPSNIRRFRSFIYGEHRDPTARLMLSFFKIQREVATTCGIVLQYLGKRWDSETQADLPKRRRATCNENSDEKLRGAHRTQLAEQFVCLVYLNFILTVVGRMRTLVMTVAGMYVLLLLSFGSYPFEPQFSFHLLMVFLLLVIVGLVAFVFAQMHRNATLSRITNTTPGELGIDFWFRLTGFVAVPLLSLLASRFPEMSNFLFSWLQPALQALK